MSLPEPASREDLRNFARQMSERFDQVDKRFEQLIESMRGIETNPLAEPRWYAKAQTSRLNMLDAVRVDFTTRIAMIEERLLELEGRIRPPRQ